MSLRIFFLAILLSLLFAVYIISHHANNLPDRAVIGESFSRDDTSDRLVGTTLPPLSLTTLEGEQRLLESYGDSSFLLLSFFATWCLPCRTELHMVNNNLDFLSKWKIGAIAIAGPEPEDRLKRFVESMTLTFPVVIDTQRTLSAHCAVTAYPTTVICDRTGKIVFYQIGLIDIQTLHDLVPRLNESSAVPERDVVIHSSGDPKNSANRNLSDMDHRDDNAERSADNTPPDDTPGRKP